MFAYHFIGRIGFGPSERVDPVSVETALEHALNI